MAGFLILLLIVGAAWFILVIPARRRRQQHSAMQDTVDVGDEIITAGGLHGIVKETGEETLQIEIAPGVVAKLDRRAVAAVARDVEVEVDPEDAVETPPEPG